MADPRKDSEILNEAYERFERAQDAYAENRALQIKDLKFLAGNGENKWQWPEGTAAERAADGRPALTVNQMPQFVRQVTNDSRQNRPSIKVRPVGDASEDVAEVYAGLIRDIEIRSGADVAYDTAVESAAACGEGYFRLITEYAADDTFEQDIRIKRIRNRFAVLLDPMHTEPEGSDAQWGFVFDRMDRREVKARYGVEPSDWDDVVGLAKDWCDKDSVLVADYYYKAYEDCELCLMPDGTVTEDPGKVKPVSRRKIRKPKVYACKVVGDRVVEKTLWPGKDIPIIKVLGEEHDTGEKYIVQGMVRPGMDAQQAFNFHYTATTEFLALQPKSPWVVAEGQDEGYEHEFAEANRKNRAVIHYKPTSHDGNLVPPPQRSMPPQASIAQMQMLQLSQELLRSSIGMYNPSLGQSSVEKSGVAIMARERQADTGTFHYQDNRDRALRYLGRQLIDIIPKIYDTRRVMRIRNAEMNEETVVIAPNPDGQPVVEERGEDNAVQKVFDLSVGRYDLYVDTGPSFATRRMEANAAMTQWVQAAPQLLGVMGDLMVKSQDWPGSEEMAKRLQATLPPQIQELLNKDEGEADPKLQQMQDQAKQALAQMAGQMKALQDAHAQAEAEKQDLNRQLQDKSAELDVRRAEIAAKVEIADRSNETKLKVEEMNNRFDMLKAQLDAQLAAASDELTQIKTATEQRDDAPINAVVEAQQQVAAAIAALAQTLGQPRVTKMTSPTTGKTYEAVTQ